MTMAEGMPVPDTCGSRYEACSLRKTVPRSEDQKDMRAAEERLNLFHEPSVGPKKGNTAAAPMLILAIALAA
jgi:hypothetical protein